MSTSENQDHTPQQPGNQPYPDTDGQPSQQAAAETVSYSAADYSHELGAASDATGAQTTEYAQGTGYYHGQSYPQGTGYYQSQEYLETQGYPQQGYPQTYPQPGYQQGYGQGIGYAHQPETAYGSQWPGYPQGMPPQGSNSNSKLPWVVFAILVILLVIGIATLVLMLLGIRDQTATSSQSATANPAPTAAPEPTTAPTPTVTALAAVATGDAWGYINTSGEVIIPPTKYERSWHFSEGWAPVYRAEGWTFVNLEGRELKVPIYSDVWQFSYGAAPVQIGGVKWGLIDTEGSYIVEPTYDEMKEGGDGLFPARIGEKWGLVDFNGQTVIDFTYDGMKPPKDGIVGVRQGNAWGYLSLGSREFIFTPQAEDVWRFGDDRGPVRIDGKWGFIDKSGKLVIQAEYDDVWDFNEGLAPVKLGEVWGYIDASGKQVIEPKYQTADVFSGGLAPVQTVDLWGYIDTTGKMVIPPQYLEARPFKATS